jgi:hypothetical protein
LLLHGGVRGGRLHAAEFERRPFVFVEIRQDLRGLDGFGREAQRRPGAHGACRFRNRCTVFGDEQTADAVIGARPFDVVLDDLDAGDLTGPDCCLQFVDRRFFEDKRLRHDLASDWPWC